jgi:hypothetical protein
MWEKQGCVKTGSYFEGVPVLLAHTCLLAVLDDVCWVGVLVWMQLFRACLERGHCSVHGCGMEVIVPCPYAKRSLFRDSDQARKLSNMENDG